jgi:hypothetical protein
MIAIGQVGRYFDVDQFDRVFLCTYSHASYGYGHAFRPTWPNCNLAKSSGMVQ